jgi:hypothetical protein
MDLYRGIEVTESIGDVVYGLRRPYTAENPKDVHDKYELFIFRCRIT